MNGNIGPHISYATVALPRVQTVFVTKENLIDVAQWCGTEKIHIPKGNEPWGFYLTLDQIHSGEPTVNVGDVVVRETNGKFRVMTREEFFDDYSLIEE